MKLSIVIIILSFHILSYSSIAQDTSETILEDVVIKAYGSNNKQTTAAAVNVFNRSSFDRYADVSIVNAINSLPGVVMEERSPGSYRLNIRGSSLRSPFGVRNVKVYYNDIPFTEPGGNTYLNALGTYNFQTLEIIKGPGSSMYGAGTGGVMLIEGSDTTAPHLASAAYTYGSYALHSLYAGLNISNHSLSFQHLQSDGFREHAALKKHILTYTGILLKNVQHHLKLSVLYTDLYYQTPGGLTRAEFVANPRQSRPASGIFPSAQQAKAAIYQNNLLAGLSYRSNISNSLAQTSVIYFAHNTLDNPAIRNYGENIEPHFGGRSHWTFTRKHNETIYKIDGGVEFQQNLNRIKVFTNNNGEPGTLQTDDKVHTQQYFAFLQVQLTLGKWIATTGASLNQMQVQFTPMHPASAIQQTAAFSNGLAPRISLLRRFNRISVYAALEKGFSPPSASELLPSGSPLNLSLRAETGWSKQIGVRGSLFRNIYADVNLFSLSLNNTIVQRRDAGGGDHFINGGATRQHGMETSLNWRLFTRSAAINKAMLWLNHTWHSFRYRNFKQLNNDYSGNRLPGNAPHIVSAGFELLMQRGFFANANWYYSDLTFLNDANTATATSYHLLGLKLGYSLMNRRSVMQLNVGADNLLNETYSNGNDINAAGGRYYNAAAGRNYYVQVKISIRKNSK